MSVDIFAFKRLYNMTTEILIGYNADSGIGDVVQGLIFLSLR